MISSEDLVEILSVVGFQEVAFGILGSTGRAHEESTGGIPEYSSLIPKEHPQKSYSDQLEKWILQREGISEGIPHWICGRIAKGLRYSRANHWEISKYNFWRNTRKNIIRNSWKKNQKQYQEECRKINLEEF